MAKKSRAEAKLLFHITACNLPQPEREYRWAAHWVGLGRGIRERLAGAGLQDWRFDFAWPRFLVAVEVEGGTWSRGRHVRGKGYAGDCVKYNWAQLCGWRVFRFTTDQVTSGEAIRFLEAVWRRDHVDSESS